MGRIVERSFLVIPSIEVVEAVSNLGGFTKIDGDESVVVLAPIDLMPKIAAWFESLETVTEEADETADSE